MNPEPPPSADFPKPRPKWGCWLLLLILAVFLALPALFDGGIIMPQARKVDARNSCYAIATALDQFHDDYQRFPFSLLTSKEDRDADTSLDAKLITVLKGLDEVENPRRQDFLGDINAAREKDGKAYNGLVETGDRMALLDPWGGVYRVRYDANADGFVENPQRDAPERPLTKTVIAWSAGKDGNFDTWGDNVSSWSDQ